MTARTDVRLRRILRAAGVSLAGTALAAALILPNTALADSQGPQVWKVAVGAQSNDPNPNSPPTVAHFNQANFFFTRKITIDEGDTVTWNSQAGEIHTVTFLGPVPPVPGVPLFVPVPPGPPNVTGIMANGMAVAPTPNKSYDGSAFTNSGLMALDSPFPTSYQLSFPKAGTYDYLCLVHSEMKATVVVQPKGTPTPRTQASYDTEASIARAIGLIQAQVVGARGFAAAAAPNKVTAGIGQLFTNLGSVAVLRFEPDRRVIRAGQTVTWTNLDPETPHTVTFGVEPSPGDPFGNFLPKGEDTPGHATISSTSQSAHSGFIIGPGAPGTFAATFTQPGTYSYICALHDDLGMKGTITVI
jgi:plastocyanin